MHSKLPIRPKGDTIDITDPEALSAWAAWLEISEAQLTRIIRIVGSSAGQVEYVFGESSAVTLVSATPVGFALHACAHFSVIQREDSAFLAVFIVAGSTDEGNSD